MGEIKPDVRATLILGDAGVWPASTEEVQSGMIPGILEAVKAGCANAGRRLAGMLPAAAGAWPFGRADWESRGPSVLSVPLLMGSVVERLSGRLRPHGFVFPESPVSLWPALISITQNTGVSIPVGTSREALQALRSLFEGLPARVTFNSLDENAALVPEARMQLVLSEMGLIRSVAGPRGSEWRLSTRPVTVGALRAIEGWYREALEVAASELEPLVSAAVANAAVGNATMISAAAQDREEIRGLVALVAAGQAALAVPLPEANKSPGGILGRIARMLAGQGANVPDLTIWEDPWSIWDFSVNAARMDVAGEGSASP